MSDEALTRFWNALKEKWPNLAANTNGTWVIPVADADARIAELEAEVERLHCCGNCVHYSDCNLRQRYGCGTGCVGESWEALAP